MKIGILGWKVGDNSFGVTSPYLNWLDGFGSVTILDYKEDVREDLDLLVLPGGPDVDPMRYMAIPHRETGKPCPFREYFDRAILPAYVLKNTPILGICRGAQTLAVAFGGALHQHDVHETSSKSRWEIVHDITYKVRDGGMIREISEGVNSIHHQTISNPGDLKVIGRYSVTPKKGPRILGGIEAVMHRTSPIVGLQYHPEELLYNRFANNLVSELLVGLDNNKYMEV